MEDALALVAPHLSVRQRALAWASSRDWRRALSSPTLWPALDIAVPSSPASDSAAVFLKAVLSQPRFSKLQTLSIKALGPFPDAAEAVSLSALLASLVPRSVVSLHLGAPFTVAPACIGSSLRRLRLTIESGAHARALELEAPALDKISDSCPDLEELEIDVVFRNPARDAAETPPLFGAAGEVRQAIASLRLITLRTNAPRYVDDMLVWLGMGSAPRLEEIRLERTGTGMEEALPSPVAAEKLAAACRQSQLRVIALAGRLRIVWPALTGAAALESSRLGPLKSVERLEMDGCDLAVPLLAMQPAEGGRRPLPSLATVALGVSRYLPALQQLRIRLGARAPALIPPAMAVGEGELRHARLETLSITSKGLGRNARATPVDLDLFSRCFPALTSIELDGLRIASSLPIAEPPRVPGIKLLREFDPSPPASRDGVRTPGQRILSGATSEERLQPLFADLFVAPDEEERARQEAAAVMAAAEATVRDVLADAAEEFVAHVAHKIVLGSDVSWTACVTAARAPPAPLALNLWSLGAAALPHDLSIAVCPAFEAAADESAHGSPEHARRLLLALGRRISTEAAVWGPLLPPQALGCHTTLRPLAAVRAIAARPAGASSDEVAELAARLARLAPRLQRVTLENGGDRCSSARLLELARRCPHLTALTVQGAVSGGVAFLSSLHEAAPRLCSLDLHVPGLDGPTAAAALAFACQAPRLRSLALRVPGAHPEAVATLRRALFFVDTVSIE